MMATLASEFLQRRACRGFVNPAVVLHEPRILFKHPLDCHIEGKNVFFEDFAVFSPNQYSPSAKQLRAQAHPARNNPRTSPKSSRFAYLARDSRLCNVRPS